MVNKKTKTFVFKGLGFPIKLIDVPMKKMAGEWVVDIDMNKFQIFILKFLISKTPPLTKDELRFIRKYLFMTTVEFGNLFGMTHTAVSQWESGRRNISPTLELCIRLYVFDHLHPKDNEFRNLYQRIDLKKLSEFEKESAENISLTIDAAEDFKIAL
jgi:DNA-binding transcriptional regulator YiaG